VSRRGELYSHPSTGGRAPPEPTAGVRVSWTILDLGPALRRLDDIDDRTLEVTSERPCLRALDHHDPADPRPSRSPEADPLASA